MSVGKTPAYLTGDPLQMEGIDRVAVLHHRRKAAMVSLLSAFERDIVPLMGEGHQQEIDDFKRSCREKLNALTFTAVELIHDGRELNEHAVELVAAHGYTDPKEDQ